MDKEEWLKLYGNTVRPFIIEEADAQETGERFMGLPDRWFHKPQWRCSNGHISKMYLKSEHYCNNVCLECHAPIWLTFPEDTEWTEEEKRIIDLWSKLPETIKIIDSFTCAVMDKITKESIRSCLLHNYNQEKQPSWPDIDIIIWFNETRHDAQVIYTRKTK